MKDIIMNLKLPQETKDFLCKTKIEEDEFEDINIKFFNKECGFLCDVVEWTKINDSTLKDLLMMMKTTCNFGMEYWKASESGV